jgi:glutamate racemase
MDDRPIGVFDSGIGGLSVVKELIKELPNESIIYFGDTARVPYGSKSTNTIRRFSVEILNFLIKYDVKAVVIACNTASAVALDLLKILSPVPVYGVIDSGVISAINKTENKKVGIIGTKTTIRTNAHIKFMEKLDCEIEVAPIACPMFVPLIEEGWIDSPIMNQVIKKYLSPLKNNVDTIILGCTHYPLIKRKIQKFIGPNVNIVCPAEELAKEIKRDLWENNKESQNVATHRFFVSDVPDDFILASSQFIKLDPNYIEKAVLDEVKIEELNVTPSLIQSQV